jgi:outer membrane protein assembly factor BamB
MDRMLLALVVMLCPATLLAQWPQWRGPARDGTSPEKGWNKDWAKRPPQVLWNANVGTGFSSLAVGGGLAFTMGNRNETDTVVALDAATGDVRWRHSYACELNPLRNEGGPKGTPTLDGDRLYTLSLAGHLFCLNAGSGKVVWKMKLDEATGTEPPNYGYAASPLVLGDLLILNCGAAGAAVRKDTGRLVWKSAAERPGHATPVPFTRNGRQAVLIFAKKRLSAVEPATGKVLWHQTWRNLPSRLYNIADPLLVGDKVFITSGYAKSCAMVSLADGKKLWEGRSLISTYLSPVLIGGHIFGGNQLRCIEPAAGEMKWKEDFGANVIVSDGVCLVLTTGGELLLAKASATGLKQLGRVRALTGKCWTLPALAGGRIYCRNATGDVVCIDLNGK